MKEQILVKFRISVVVILISVFINHDISTAEGSFDFGIRTGLFVPEDSEISGKEEVRYSSDGTISDIYAYRFGDGYDVMFYASYSISDWVFRFESGIRTLGSRSLKLERTNHLQEYDNSLRIYPVNLSILRRLSLPGSSVTPYAGLGVGIYISRWEERSFRREWSRESLYLYKGSENPLGFSFLVGASYPLYKMFSIDCEYSYSYIKSNWDLKLNRVSDGVSGNYIAQRSRLNIGGSSFRIGFSYRL